ncbi:large conductance mechanosensitive channel protein MscL [Gryllotalpicola ginsengisoli]|uniref:large conductance mechanosensitive channel protein MscL n=1 Tax=Gryllotalpicola ginsengisoli TaxID=444608 RepID=UPI0003B7A399|nr:large conductance mechanosensitive channel protein MscL [Gryllotalpicola ginsengisoli]
MLKGFKEFLMRGNVIDLAVAVVIGAAFGALVTAVVEKIINPLISAVFNASSLDKALQVQIPTVSGGHATLAFGAVIAAAINFVIIAAVVYFAFVVPLLHLQRLRKTEEAEEVPAGPSEAELLTQIRDLLAVRTDWSAAGKHSAAE